MSDLVGSSISRYHVISQLGEGGMASVFKAYDTRLECDVALKVIRREDVTPRQLSQLLKRFEREAKMMARLSHPNILGVRDYGDHDGMPYLVMEYIPGGTLREWTGKLYPYQEAARLLLPVARALAYAHQQGSVHRDVKPSNILMTESGEPMLADFGIAKILEGMQGTTKLTATGVGIGTPEYMAPEQGMGKDVDHRVDIYALGVIFYELVTGRTPFQADTPMAVVLKHINDPLPRPSDLNPDLPEAVEAVLFKALAKDPAERYADMKAFAAALEKLAAAPMPSKPTEHLPQESPAHSQEIPTRTQEAPIEEPTRPRPLKKPPRIAGLPRWACVSILGLVGLGFIGLVVVGIILFKDRLGLGTVHTTGLETADPASESTPTASPSVPLNPKNAAYITELARFGKGSILDFAFSPDGTLLAVVAGDGIYLYDFDTLNEVLFLEESTETYKLAFSPDGAILAAGGYDDIVRLWKLPGGDLLKRLEGHESGITCLAFSADGATLASGGWDKKVLLWRVTTGALALTLEHKDSLDSVAFSPDGKILATASYGQPVNLWNPSSGKSLGTIEGPHYWHVNNVVFSPDGELLASASGDGTICLWDVPGFELQRTIETTEEVTDIAISPDSKMLMSGMGDGSLYLWTVSDGALISAHKGVENRSLSAAFSPDGSTLAYNPGRSTIHLLRTWDGQSQGMLEGHLGSIQHLVISPDDATLTAAMEDGTINRWQISSGELLLNQELYTESLYNLILLPDGEVAVQNSVSELQLMSVSDGETLWRLDADSDEEMVFSVAFSPGCAVSWQAAGCMLASGHYEGALKLWQVSDGTLIRTLTGHEGIVGILAFSPNGNMLASSGGDDTVRLWDVASGGPLLMLEEDILADNRYRDAFTFSPACDAPDEADECLLASASYVDGVHLWRVSDGELLHTFEVNQDNITSLAFTPAGYMLATGAWSGDIHLWRVSDGKFLETYRGHKFFVADLDFTSNGEMLASGSADGTVRLWGLAPD